MKKLIGLVMLCAFTMTNVYGQSIAKQLKSDKKAIQARVKELTADGWKSLQSDGLAKTVSDHNERKRNNPNLEELLGTANQVKTLNLGKAQARNNAINEYAELCGGMLRARITSDLRNINEEQADNLVSGYERILTQKLNGEVRPSYYIYKENNGGKYDVRGIFFIDLTVLERKQKEAIKEAADDAKVAFDYGQGISDFIKQGLNQ